jgi:hypothetical protein
MSRLSPAAVCGGAVLVAAAAAAAALLRSPLFLAPPLSEEHAHLRLPDQPWGDRDSADAAVRPFHVPSDDDIVAHAAAQVRSASLCRAALKCCRPPPHPPAGSPRPRFCPAPRARV